MYKNYRDNQSEIQSSNGFTYMFHQYWVDETDRRLRNYYLISGGPAMFVTIMVIWLAFVMKLGPNIMAHRKPLALNRVLMIHNFILVLINGYFIYAALNWLTFGRKSLDPKLPDRNDWSDGTLYELNQKVFYFYTKLIDLFDTVFFVLRKKSNQISFLHIYHHFMVPVLGFLTAKLCPQTVVIEVFCLLNSIIHTLMYSYYLLSAFGPQIQPYLWWKRYLTRLQLIQFAILIVYAIYCVLFGDLSEYPKPLKYLAIIQPFIFFYIRKRKSI
ncbi:unnamed protein product [Medioppia subpectinata]|uniref:Elongation of very long chain fatty acids protein n=1 Tax=Medioppia subpectinata TaxID=1979941 RepID=A0A7R9L387_9ACAR|nr:unnamed protein product [Medioppia subpectinata]CAG2114470.1 unnamed protein product [Medioppia subpectinata]